MNLSLNEIEATAKRAVRGAGYPWGLAEEAAKATRWLCSRDVDGCLSLAGHLSEFDGTNAANRSPKTDDGIWVAENGALCPIATGAALTDLAHEFSGNTVQLGQIVQPVLLAPYAAFLALRSKCTVTVQWKDGAFSTDGERLCLTGQVPEQTPWVTIRSDGHMNEPNKHCQRANPNPDIWKQLSDFAHRTFAPATEESRRKGAGAGMSDND